MSVEPSSERGDWQSERMRIRHREHLLELGVFLLLVLPSLVINLLVGPEPRPGFTITAAATILRDAGLVALIFYFLRRNREPAAQIGWAGRNWVLEAVLGVILFVPFLYLTNLLRQVLARAGLPAQAPALTGFLTPHTPAQTVLAFLLVATVAVSEETIFRGYLIHRFREATNSSVVAVLFAAGIFALGHAYEGTLGMATVGIMGLLLSAVYLWRRSLVAVIVIHFLQDFLALLLAPLFHG